MQKNPLKPVVSLHPMVRIDSAQAPLSNGVLTSIPIFLSLESFQHDSVEMYSCICRLQPFTVDTLGGGNLRGPNIPVP
jgi:hypothetical protein